MDDLRVRLLGGFRVSVGTRDIPDADWHLRKAKTLVKLLALAPGHRLHRDQIVDLLWPDLDPGAAGNQLRKVLHEARRSLDPNPGRTYYYIESGEQVTLNRSRSWVDVDAFERAAFEARRLREPSAYDDAIAMYDGDLLPEDRYADWAMHKATALRDEFLALLLELARLLEANAEFDRAAAALRRIVVADSANEEAHVALMRVYALAGRRHEALRAYDRLRDELRRELDAEPEVGTQRLHEQIMAGRALTSEQSAGMAMAAG
jgi:DNA-binding SARP family transcriptional activator